MIKGSRIPLRAKRGFVLVFALLILAILTMLGIAALMTSTTDIKIAGNVGTATRALYIAEGGMEAISTELENSANNNFKSGGTVANDCTVGTTTLTNPVTWVGTSSNWYIDGNNDGEPDTLLSALNATWPIYKSVTVGGGEARVALKRPNWFSSAPTRVSFPQALSRALVPSPRSITTDLEIEFENSLLFFQAFTRSNGTPITKAAFDAGAVYIGSSGNDRGIDGTTGLPNLITGVFTYDSEGSNQKALVIYKSTDGGATWQILGEPVINANARIFALGQDAGGLEMGRLYNSPMSNPEEPEVPAGGCNPSLGSFASFAIGASDHYRVLLKNTNSLTLTGANGPDCASRKWTSYTAPQF